MNDGLNYCEIRKGEWDELSVKLKPDQLLLYRVMVWPLGPSADCPSLNLLM